MRLIAIIFAWGLISGALLAQESSAPSTFAATTPSAEYAPEYVAELMPSYQQQQVNSLVRGNDLLRKAGISTYRTDSYGRTKFYGYDGRRYSASSDSLPPAADPNDFSSNPLIAAPSLGVAAQSRYLQALLRPLGTPFAEALPDTAYALQVRPGVYYDTGAFDTTVTRFLPGAIALDNSPAARKRGNTTFSNLGDDLTEVPIRGQINNMFEGSAAGDFMQVYLDSYFPGQGSISARSYFARAYSGETGFLFGKAETAFGDLGSSPVIVNPLALPIGAPGNVHPTNFTLASINQLRLTRRWMAGQLESTLSLEEAATNSDVVANSQDLHKWPAFVSRIRYNPQELFDSYQLAAMYRPIGFISPTFVERYGHGWGLSLIVRKANEERTRAIYFGAVGGEGIGGYIFGDIKAAVVNSPESISLLQNIGGYIAYQQVLVKTDEQTVSTNFAYGIVDSEAVTADENAQLQQAWCNLLWNATDAVSMGVEYQYGHRLVEDRRSGDNHRFGFILQVTGRSGATIPKEATAALRGIENSAGISNWRL